jgi:dodecin
LLNPDYPAKINLKFFHRKAECPILQDSPAPFRSNECLIQKGGDFMAARTARITEIIAASPKSFEDAINQGFKRASKTLRGITGMKVIEQRIAADNNKIIEYRVRLEVIFVLES